LGQKLKIAPKNKVRFTPESGNVQRTQPYLLWANSDPKQSLRRPLLNLIRC
jgi:hypothetical protein